MQINSERFEGFELPGGNEGSLLVPTAYFERVLMTEPASVSRLVWYFLSRSLEELEKGALIEEITVTASYSELENALNLAHSSIGEGLKRALDAGYLRLVHTGENGHSRSRYAINWRRAEEEVKPPEEPGGRNGGNSENSRREERNTKPEGLTQRYSFHTSTAPANYARACHRITGEEPHWHCTGKPTTDSEGDMKNHRAGKKPGKAGNEQSGKKPGKTDSINHNSTFLSSESLFSKRVESQIEPLFLPAPLDRKMAGQEPSSPSPASQSKLSAPPSCSGSTAFPEVRTSLTHPAEAPHWLIAGMADELPGLSPAGGTQPEKQKVRLPATLASLNRAFSLELGDSSHTPSNHAQIRNLWQASGLSASRFAEVMYRARELTRSYALLRPGEPPPPPGQVRNRMPYFFATLRSLLKAEVQSQSYQVRPLASSPARFTGWERYEPAGRRSYSHYPLMDHVPSSTKPGLEEWRVERPVAETNGPNLPTMSGFPPQTSSPALYPGPQRGAYRTGGAGRAGETASPKSQSRQGQGRLYESWLVAAGLKQRGRSPERAALGGWEKPDSASPVIS
ncbi:MAG TPA: hypothetical protein VH186_32255 [Chloroflexia bacterium]|nr:hypothetical protein [Chloroflexia bacterium]